MFEKTTQTPRISSDSSVVLKSDSSKQLESVPNSTFSRSRSSLIEKPNGYINSGVRLANPGVDAFFFDANKPIFASPRSNEASAFLAKHLVDGIPNEDALRLMFGGESENFRNAFADILDGESSALVSALFALQDAYVQDMEAVSWTSASNNEGGGKFYANRILFSSALLTLATVSSLSLDDQGVEKFYHSFSISKEDREKAETALDESLKGSDFKSKIEVVVRSMKDQIVNFVQKERSGLSMGEGAKAFYDGVSGIIGAITFSGGDYNDLMIPLIKEDMSLKMPVIEIVTEQAILLMKGEALANPSLDAVDVATGAIISALRMMLPTGATINSVVSNSKYAVYSDMVKALRIRLGRLASDDLAKSFRGVHRAIINLNDKRTSLLNFIGDRANSLTKSFERVEELAKSFVHNVILVSQAQSVDEARAILASFRKSSLFRNSGANQLINAASISRTIDTDSLKRVLSSMNDTRFVAAFNQYLPSELKGLSIDDSSDIPSIPGVPARRLKIDVSGQSKLVVDTSGRLVKLNDIELGNFGAVFQSTNPSNGISPLTFYVLRMNSMIGSTGTDSMILGGRSTSFLLDGIQLPSIIKDSLLAEIRSVSIAIAAELAAKREAYKDWGRFAILSVKDLTRYLRFFIGQNSLSFELDGSVSLREKNMLKLHESLATIVADETLRSYPDSSNSNSLPYFNVFVSGGADEQPLDGEEELRVVRSILDSKKHLLQLADFVSKVNRFSLSYELATSTSMTAVSNVLELKEEALKAGLLVPSASADYEGYIASNSHESILRILQTGTVSSISHKLIPSFWGPAVQYMISLHPHANSLSSVLDYSGNLSKRWGLHGQQTTPDELTRSVLASMFKELFSYRMISASSSASNLSYIYRRKSGIFLSMLRFARSPFEGSVSGSIPDEVYLTPSSRRDEMLERVLNAVGLSSFDRITKKQAIDLASLIRPGGLHDTMPVEMRDNYLEKFSGDVADENEPDINTEASLADVVMLSPYGESFISSNPLSQRNIVYIRTNEFIEMMCANSITVSESGLIKTFWMNKYDEIFFKEGSERIEVIARAEINFDDRETMNDSHAKSLLIAIFNQFRSMFTGILDYSFTSSHKITESTGGNKSALIKEITKPAAVDGVVSQIASNSEFFKKRMADMKARLSKADKLHFKNKEGADPSLENVE